MAYIIQKGETLGGIAAKKGTTVQDLLKFNPQIKDPNLIYAGASLNLPTSSATTGFSLGQIPAPTPVSVTKPPVVTKAPSPVTQPTAPANKPTIQSNPTVTQPVTQPTALPEDILSKLSSMAEVSSGQDYRTQLTNLISGLGTQQKSYLDLLKGQPTAEQQYETYRTKLGLPEKEAQLQKTEALLNSLEDDINARISGMGITEPQRRRVLASEQAPLVKQLGILQPGVTSAREQLSQLLQMAGQEQTRQGEIAKAPFELTQQLLPTISSLSQYQSPQEKLAQTIAEAKAKAELEQQYATPKAADTITTDKGVMQWNPKTQRYDIFAGAKAITATSPTSITGANYNSRLSAEISNLYAGRYGTKGAREQVINLLKTEFPNVDVAKDIYNRVPNEWEASMKPQGRMTASTINPQALSDLQDDIGKGAQLNQLYEAYPEVSPSLIQSLYYNQ